MSAEDKNEVDKVPKDFWEIIEYCGGSPDRLEERLSRLSGEDIIRFCWNYEEAQARLGALYYALSQYSEDGIEEICAWVVARGKSAYAEVWESPEELILSEESPYGRPQSDPGLLGKAMSVYEERFGHQVITKWHDKYV